MPNKSLKRLVTEKVRAAFGGGACVPSITPLPGDAPSRRYYRALVDRAVAPPSVIIMELVGSTLPLSSKELAVLKEPLKDIPFLNLHRFFSRVGVRIPRVYGVWLDDGILLLEDLGERSLWDFVQVLSPAEIVPWYEKAIEQLLLIQISGTQARDDSCIAFKKRFDFRLCMWEFDHFIEYALEKKPGGKISRPEKETLLRSFEEISRHLHKQSPCLNHGDFHSWNLMVSGGEVAVIDFQDALLAPAQYDLASLLNNRETDRLIRPDIEDHLIRYYMQKRHEAGEAEIGRDEFVEIYIISTLQRDFKFVGRSHYLDLVKGKPGYKKYLPPTLKRIKRNLLRLPQLERIVPLLAAHFEEME